MYNKVSKSYKVKFAVNQYLASLNFFWTPGLSWFLLLRNQRSTCLSDQPCFLHAPFISSYIHKY